MNRAQIKNKYIKDLCHNHLFMIRLNKILTHITCFKIYTTHILIRIKLLNYLLHIAAKLMWII
jgi:hypothetical protein